MQVVLVAYITRDIRILIVMFLSVTCLSLQSTGHIFSVSVMTTWFRIVLSHHGYHVKVPFEI